MKKIAIMILMSIILVSCSSKKEETQKIEQQAKLEKEKKETEKMLEEQNKSFLFYIINLNVNKGKLFYHFI